MSTFSQVYKPYTFGVGVISFYQNRSRIITSKGLKYDVTSFILKPWKVVRMQYWYCNKFMDVYLQSNLCFKTTAKRNHLSYKTTLPGTWTYISIYVYLWWKTTCHIRPPGVVVKHRFHCVNTSSFSYLLEMDVVRSFTLLDAIISGTTGPIFLKVVFVRKVTLLENILW